MWGLLADFCTSFMLPSFNLLLHDCILIIVVRGQRVVAGMCILAIWRMLVKSCHGLKYPEDGGSNIRDNTYGY